MKRLFLLLVMMISGLASAAHAQPEATNRIGTFAPRPIAISMFYADNSGHQQFARDIPQVIENNLVGSGLFRSINKNAFVQTPESVFKEGIRFPEWKATGTESVVTGTVMSDAQGRTRVEFRLWDVISGQQLIGMAYTTTPANWRRISHIISDEIYKRLTGEDAYFDTRIVYVAEAGSSTKRVKRLAIMDQDGANHKFLTDGSYMVLTPRFSPETQRLTYMSYQSGVPKVYLYDINTGGHQLLGSFPGMTFAPRFSPDGRKVIMSMAKGGNTDIYEMPLGGQPRRITTAPGIETSPSYAPEGNKIVFESDRTGTQQLYIMNSDGSGEQRLTFGQGRYANPVWSPRGDFIAFTRMYQGSFYIGVIRPDGSGERMVATAYHAEGPSWSPNGRVLTYFKEGRERNGREKESYIYTIDITGFNEKVLKTPRFGSDPAWSPINP